MTALHIHCTLVFNNSIPQKEKSKSNISAIKSQNYKMNDKNVSKDGIVLSHLLKTKHKYAIFWDYILLFFQSRYVLILLKILSKLQGELWRPTLCWRILYVTLEPQQQQKQYLGNVKVKSQKTWCGMTWWWGSATAALVYTVCMNDDSFLDKTSSKRSWDDVTGLRMSATKGKFTELIQYWSLKINKVF